MKMEKIEMTYKFSFEKLEVWKIAKDFVKSIYEITSEFPNHERYGLVSQINRAAVSVASTIAEGSARVSRKDQSHFYQIAYGSLMEVACQLIISRELGYINEDKYEKLRKNVHEISNKLNALRNYQLKSIQFNNSTFQRFNK